MNYERFDDLEVFINEALHRGLKGVVLRWTHEIRPSYEGTRVTVGPVERWALLGYHKPRVLLLEKDGRPPDGIVGRLEGVGLTVRKVRDNIS